MRRILLVAIPLLFVALLVLFRVLPKSDYRLSFARLEVESATLYLSSESAESGKKMLTAETDLDALYEVMDGLRPQGKYRDRNIPDGGYFLGIEFQLTDGSTVLFSYLQTSQYGRGYFTDGEQYFEASNLELFDFWYTLNYEMQPLESGETERFPSIWQER